MSLFDTLDVSASGLAAQRRRVEVLAQNIANAETTRTPEGGPYRRRQIVFEAVPSSRFADELEAVRVQPVDGRQEPPSGGVRVAGIELDPAPPQMRYEPEHPDADANGFVAYPGYDPVRDMVDLSSATRSYQANLAAVNAVRQMIVQTIETAG
ncbi:MAG: flagellar basal body rod protein FlgC [Acidobacteria bacterium]|nr:flagellar basal body rod protein FlgC [Acidobacteriota bacterium]